MDDGPVCGGSGSGGGIRAGARALAWLCVLLIGGEAAPATANLSGRYTGTATVTTSPFYPPGAYDAEVAIAQTASGIVGFVNIAFDPGDVLGGTITHTFSAPVGTTSSLDLRYSDRQCGAGDPIGKCYPQGAIQYSFEGQAALAGTELTLSQPAILPGLPYAAVLPFDSLEVSRVSTELRTTFDGELGLEYIWPGTVLLPVPLPLFGSNQVLIQNGEILEWVADDGDPVSVPGVVTEWCFDDARGLGWMSQQGVWDYHWILDPDGEALSVFVTFDSSPPDCGALPDPLAADLDAVHRDLVGVMIEPAIPAPGVAAGLSVSLSGAAMLQLTWVDDCGFGDRYGIYRGDLAAGTSSLARVAGRCAVRGTSATLPLGTGTAEFYLVVPNDGTSEGSYGVDSTGAPRPPATSPCRPQTRVDRCAP